MMMTTMMMYFIHCKIIMLIFLDNFYIFVGRKRWAWRWWQGNKNTRWRNQSRPTKGKIQTKSLEKLAFFWKLYQVNLAKGVNLLPGSPVNGLLEKMAVKSKAWSDLSSVLKHGTVSWLFKMEEKLVLLWALVSMKVAVSKLYLKIVRHNESCAEEGKTPWCWRAVLKQLVLPLSFKKYIFDFIYIVPSVQNYYITSANSFTQKLA